MDQKTMGEQDKIIIHQTLHGYKEGHKLISSSIDLSDVERRSMLIYSDYSGSGIEKEFSEYLTGYPLPNSKFFVFAKTWYANEMKRPGCVWTHSLLIDFTDLWEIRNMKELLHLFRRPEENSSLRYLDPIEFQQKQSSSKNAVSQNFYSICYELYSHPKEGLVILCPSSRQFQQDILDIWSWQWPRMKRSFTFSTGSLSLRQYEGKLFDLQIAPIRRQRSLLQSQSEEVNVVTYDELPTKNEWIEQFKSFSLKEIQEYMIRYGSDVLGTRENFSALLDSMVINNDKTSNNLTDLITFFENYFTDPNSARQLKLKIIDSFFRTPNNNKSSALSLILSNKTFSGITWDFKKMIEIIIKEEEVDQSLISRLVKKMYENKFDDQVATVLSVIPPNIIAKSNLTPELLIELVSEHPNFQDVSEYWNSDEETQKKWFNIFKKSQRIDWQIITNHMLDAGVGRFSDELHDIVGDEIFTTLVNWLAKNDTVLSIEWVELIRTNQEAFFNSLSTKKQLTKNTISIFLETSNPYASYWKQISNEILEKFLQNVAKTKLDTETIGVYTFFINACYHDNLSQPELINTMLFQKLHDKLSENIVEINTWERFKWYMGRELHLVIEQNYLSKLYKDKNKVPDWDRCEFLRRSLVVSYLKYDWNPLALIHAIKDKNTFEKVVAFGVEIRECYLVLKHLYKFLKSNKEEPSFHIKVLKNAVG